ncbi:hypothetical protein Q5H91_02810 [Sphingomonas sp. KR1UV-12]|uniref:Lipoprotein n=1 Tax=Sphingomonas aurea TaxID=3063994 RepID=A0ABT9EGN4_9SPHN|nr:hypothetical protein [Sphingomonas sp. KR1UV-12]MDP1026130.1 hypothetical protein [Sphingomonas sp. KR1UV-12]
MAAWVMKAAALAGALAASACSGGAPGSDTADEGNRVSLRNLTESEVASSAADREFRLKGTLVPTPSDTRSRHFLLRERRTITGNIVAILREERGDKVAYARTEVDCARRLFHVLGVGPSRASAEVATTYDGPLRPITGLPLREELASFICERSGTPLAKA